MLGRWSFVLAEELEEAGRKEENLAGVNEHFVVLVGEIIAVVVEFWCDQVLQAIEVLQMRVLPFLEASNQVAQMPFLADQNLDVHIAPLIVNA